MSYRASRAMRADRKAAAVIPARLGSTRLPEKVLADLGGKPVIRWVWETCRDSGLFTRVIVAADHEKVRKAAEGFGAEAVMTDPAHGSGTERVAEVAGGLTEEIVVNAQGDEPFLEASTLGLLVEAAGREGVDVSTPVTPVESPEELADPSVVKAVFGGDGRALYFSRWPVPFDREGWAGEDPWRDARKRGRVPPGVWWRHLGIYAFRRARLLDLVRLPPAPAELREKLEQLRWLHHGAVIRCVPVKARGLSIDTYQDLERARLMIGDRG